MISDALRMKPAEIEVGGTRYRVSRPSVLDMIDALEHSRQSPQTMLAWLVWRHLLEQDGSRAFETLDQVLACDAHAVTAIGQQVQLFYEEGRS